MGTLTRLRSMSAREIGYRLRERLRIEMERRRVNRRDADPADDDAPGAHFKKQLEDAVQSRFYIGPRGPETVRTFVRTRFPEWITQAVAEAEQLAGHRVDLLGHAAVDLGSAIEWYKDPVTGTVWPDHFWADFDPVNDISSGDSKTIHELNRHQYLPRLGKAYFLTGERRFAAEAIAQIESWIEWNPEGEGINWQSSLEISIRVLSWLWTIAFLLPSVDFTERFARHVTRSLLAQIRHIYRYPSVYSSPNTHLIAEGAALFVVGTVFSGGPIAGKSETRKWRDLGAKLLQEAINRQVLSDGVHFELSTYYHCYATDFFLQALVLARRNEADFPPPVWHTVEKMLEFVMHASDNRGVLPPLGDDDGGRALALKRQDYRSYTDGLCLGAALFHRGDFKRQAARFHEEAFWILGEEAWTRYQHLTSLPPSVKSRGFSDAGYFVQRSGWDPRDQHLIFDCGGLGQPSGGHGHADALSIVLSSGGRAILADPGTYVYNAAPEWRNSFRSSAAHNTVVVDRQSQSIEGGTFQWQTRAGTSLVRHFAGEGLAGESLEYLEGRHDGYERLAKPVVHNRRLLYSPPDYWVVVDELTGSGTHTFDFYYHFPPDVNVELRSSPGEPVQARGAGWSVFFDATAEYGVQLVRGKVPRDNEPPQGWVSPRYGALLTAQTLRTGIRSEAPMSAATVIAMSGAVRRQDVVGCALAFDIREGRRTDLFLLPRPHSSVEVAGYRLEGELFRLRSVDGVCRQLFGVGVRGIAYGETQLFSGRDPAGHLFVNVNDDGFVIESGDSEEKTYVRYLRNPELRYH